MTIIDGKKTAEAIRSELKERTAYFERTHGRKICLAVVLVGNDSASQIYVGNKVKACEEVGILSRVCRLTEEVSQDEAENAVLSLAADESVHGILVQLPLPRHLNAEDILSKIPPEKDVDGFSAEHIGAIALNTGGTASCTPAGIMELLRRYHIDPAGKRAVVIGRSKIVGRPMALLLLNADATVTVCHTKTQDLAWECRNADILVAAAGKPKLITGDMVKEGAVVIDVGMNRDENGKLCGDVDFESVKKKASFLTPVPGGVGPMTVAMLLKNTVNAAERQCK